MGRTFVKTYIVYIYTIQSSESEKRKLPEAPKKDEK